MSALARPAPAARPAGPPHGHGRRTLLLLVALFALPVVSALALHLAGWRPTPTPPHGRLLAAPVPLDWRALRTLPGTPGAEALPGHWTLVLAGAGPCEARCAEQLASLRRIQVATNQQMPRIKRLWLAPDPAADPAHAGLTARYPDLLLAAPGNTAWRHLLPAEGLRLHLLDPEGRPVMDYPEPFEPRGVLGDLERLLRYSWTG